MLSFPRSRGFSLAQSISCHCHRTKLRVRVDALGQSQQSSLVAASAVVDLDEEFEFAADFPLAEWGTLENVSAFLGDQQLSIVLEEVVVVAADVQGQSPNEQDREVCWELGRKSVPLLNLLFDERSMLQPLPTFSCAIELVRIVSSLHTHSSSPKCSCGSSHTSF